MKKDNSYFLAVSAILIVIAAWAYCYIYGFGGYKTKISDMDSISDEVKSAQEKLSSLTLTQAAIEKDEALINSTLVAVSDGADTENVISEIEALAAQQSLAIPSIQITDGSGTGDEVATTSSSTDSVSLGFSVTGSFESINTFIDALENDVKFMTVNSLSISSSEDQVSATIELNAYKRPASS